jgi:hypothetical protein
MRSPSAVSSAAAPALAALDADRLRLLAVAFLIAFGVFVQLDAVANRLSAGSPVSLIEFSLGGLVAATMLVLSTPDPRLPNAVGQEGVRLILLLLCWAVFAWTLSRFRAEGLGYLVKLATAIVPALCLIAIADRAAHLRALIWAIILAGAFAAAVVLIETRTHTRLFATALAATTADFDGVARSSGGSDQNPTTAAQMLLVSTTLAIGLLFSGERRGRWLLGGIAALGSAGLALMSARSAILGLGAGMALVVFAFRRKSYFPLILFAAAVAGAVGILFAPPTLIARFTAIGDFGQDQTLYRRITYLRIGGDLLRGSPVWGVGPGNFPSYYVQDAYRYMPGRELYPRELHNTYLDTAVEYGLVGFGIFAAIVGHALLAARRGFADGASAALARTSFAVAVALAALLVACFFMPHKDMRYLWLLIALAIQCGRLRAAERPR